MKTRFLLATSVLAMFAPWAAAEEPKSSEYVRIDVRGELWEYVANPIRKPDIKRHIVTVGRGDTQQSFHLELGDDAARTQVKELLGKSVVITGDLTFRYETEGRPKDDPLRKNVIRVKSVKKAE
ncbi:MAG TPA: hypothetical protein VHR66_31385 [Gemmataceae bacterium]|jgi:hypothetical protein|nr:hypothetical protein [Gemmataceae bacterium]